jgi:hypothetical protein
VTLVILLLALLALCACGRSEPRAQYVSPLRAEAAKAFGGIAPEERHRMDDGLSSQPLLSRPGVAPGKARPAMTSLAQAMRSPWQGDALIAPNLPHQKGLKASHAGIPSGDAFARAPARAS